MAEDSNLEEIKIAAVDDHDLIRQGLKFVLVNNGLPNIDLYGTAEELIACLEEGKSFDLYILDLELPDSDGFVLIDKIRKLYPSAKIIVSTIHDEIWTLRKLLSFNVNSIIYKSDVSHELITAIEEIFQGNTYFCKGVKDALKFAEDKTLHPSSRELEVLEYLAQGKNTKEIANVMFVSENTVEAHRKALLSKLSAKNVADLIMKSIIKGYVK